MGKLQPEAELARTVGAAGLARLGKAEVMKG